MTKYHFIGLIAVVLTGCADLAGVPQRSEIDDSTSAKQMLIKAPLCCSDFSSVTMQPLHNGTFTIDANSNVMQFPSGRSAFYAGAIPTEYYGAEITAASIIGSSVMPLQILLLDAQRQPSRTLDEHVFAYSKSTLFSPNSFSGTFKLLPNERFMVIFANTANLDRTLSQPNPETLKARAQGFETSAYPDVKIPYSPWGQITLKFNSQTNLIPVTPSIGSTTDTTSTPSPSDQQINNVTVSPQTQKYYQQAIQQAVKNNQIEQAMQLVAEAEKLGFSDARNVFVDAVKQK